MPYKRLFILVEGTDDERFINSIIKPVAKKEYDLIQVVKYASLKKDKIDNYIKSIGAMKADYIFIADINSAPCITSKRRKIKNEHRKIDENRVVIVIKEIESWYLAGVNQKSPIQNKSLRISNTNDISKERFNNFIPRKWSSRIDFMIEILKGYSIETACKKNDSFKYFFNKHLKK